MVNLLPQKTVTQLKRTYYVRLGTVFSVLVAAAFFIGGVLLVPSYVVSGRAADASERYLAAVEETIGVRERAGVSTEVRALSERIRILDSFSTQPSALPLFEDALSELSPNIRVTGIGFAKGDDALNVSIAGTAATRTALLSFADRLRATGRFEGVTVPVSQLALDSDIPFSITATYNPAP